MATGQWGTLALAGWCGLLAVETARGDAPAADEAAVRQVVDRFFDAYARKDLDGFMALWSAQSPDLAARRQTAQAIFAETGPIGVKDLSVVRLRVEGPAARVRVRLEMLGDDAKTGRPYAGFGKLGRTLRLAKEGADWKVRWYGP